jgi:ectoine hydroxylase-related dioxygenase (phytanoyl-CoA dioxygenase family)
VYASVLAAAAPILGPNAILLPEDFWVFFVPPGDGASSRWTAFAPHKDWVGGDSSVMAGGVPSVLVGWVALTDATADDSCMYVVPGDADRGYRTEDRVVRIENFRMQDVRAVPAVAGQVLLFSTHISHWGSRSSRWATHPRISISMFFQRGDVPPRLADVLDLTQPVPVEARARWMLRTLRLMMGREQSEAIMRSAGLSVPPSA